MDAICQIARRYNIKIIEDSCEALGATYKGRPADMLGDIGLFAFYPNKQMTTGEGGVLITNDDNVAMLARSMRNQGRDPSSGWLGHPRLGYNYRMPDILAALGTSQCPGWTSSSPSGPRSPGCTCSASPMKSASARRDRAERGDVLVRVRDQAGGHLRG